MSWDISLIEYGVYVVAFTGLAIGFFMVMTSILSEE